MSDFPAWFYGPDGAACIFERAEDIPAGWVDSPAKVGAEPVKAEPKPRKRKGR